MQKNVYQISDSCWKIFLDNDNFSDAVTGCVLVHNSLQLLDTTARAHNCHYNSFAD